MLKNDYFNLPDKYLPLRWRRASSLIPQSRHLIKCSDNSSIELRSLVQYLEVESLKTKDRFEVAYKELDKVIKLIKGMPDQEQFDDFQDVVNNGDECGVENPIASKTKGGQKDQGQKE
ncbi:hypothetical protein Lal_00017434 [Lupinus albus]|uniref:Uncharacterized protein n=1 Tax=Lupinus albus TaxID=3870 RepID=A0A6A4QQD8_LUPAL|nr:hypothetical protein Lalb_Chr04g0261881 [Lupinus albus]KAF1869857.1 hypothetical protein Lal_00017434 [Lupinus albus]